MTTGFVETSAGASRGGFQGIKKIRGVLSEIKKVPPRFTDSDYGAPKEQIEFTLEDAEILEMFPGEDEFELKDGKYTGWITYAEVGKSPSANSAYIKCWVASAEKLGKKPTDFIGQVVVLDKVDTLLFKKPKFGDDKKPILDAEGKKVMEEIRTNRVFGFAGEESAGSTDNKTYVTNALVGLNQKAALRKLLTDPKTKQFPEYKAKLADGTLAEYLGLTIVDDKFALKAI